jgi:hypothetical protein
MRRLLPVVLRPWSLPLIVLALIAPTIVAFSLGGPHIGLAVGALTATALIVLAARAGYDEPIEVAPTEDRRYRVAVLSVDPVEDPARVEAVARIAAEGERARPGAGDSEEPHVLVVAPAVSSTLDRWASDVRASRRRARRSVAVSMASLTAAGLEAAGRVADGDPVQALEDELRSYPADEVVVVTGAEIDAGALEEIRRRLDRPVRELG